MGSITVYLNPALDGAKLELRYRSYGLDELLFTFYSVDGVWHTSQGTLTNYDVFQVRFPPQTVNGVAYKEARTNSFVFYGDVEYSLDLVEAGPSLATVTTRGRGTGGFPAPNLLLEVYDQGVKIASIDIGVVVSGNWYELEAEVTGPGVHTVYGRMVLTNPLGSYEFTTPTEEFELG